MTFPLRPDPPPREQDPRLTAADPQSVAAWRRQLRETAIALRNGQDSDRIAAWSRALCERLAAAWPHPPGKVIGFCWPMQNEPDLRPQVLRWWAQGATPVLPVVIAPGLPLLFRPWVPEPADAAGSPEVAGAAMVPDRYGIPTPVAGPERVPDVLLLPLNAFDLAGYRIGYGGGFFDRTLAALAAAGQRPLCIGVGFDLAEVASTHPQPHDERLDFIVTENRTLRL